MPKPTRSGGASASVPVGNHYDDDDDYPTGGGISSFRPPTCNCSQCMRKMAKSAPMRDDTKARIESLEFIVADVFSTDPGAEDQIQPEHRKRAKEIMDAVSKNDGKRLAMYLNALPTDQQREEVCEQIAIPIAQLGHTELFDILDEATQHQDEPAWLDSQEGPRSATPLMYAAHNGHSACVRKLLELGADPDIADTNAYTALVIATFCDRSSVVEALVEHGASIEDKDTQDGRTALGYAAMYGATDCIHVLGKGGANPFEVDGRGYDILELAEQSGRPSAVEAVKMLQQRWRMRERHEARREKVPTKQQPNRKAEAARAKADADAQAAALLAELEAEEAREAARKAEEERKKKEAALKRAEAEFQKKKAKQEAEAAAAAAKAAAKGGAKAKKGAAAAGLSGSSAAGPSASVPTMSVSMPAGVSVPTVSSFGALAATGYETEGSGRGRESAASTPEPADAAAGAGSEKEKSGKQRAKVGREASNSREPGSRVNGAVATSTGSVGSSAGGVGAAAGESAQGPAPSESYATLGVEALRAKWDTLLEGANKCKDAALQPRMLAQVQAMIEPVAAAGVSVKYGRKVLQRLEAVAPGRAALRAALNVTPHTVAGLEEAMGVARPALALLEPELVESVKAALERAKAMEAQARWLAQAQQMQAQSASRFAALNLSAASSSAPSAQQPSAHTPAPAAPVPVAPMPAAAHTGGPTRVMIQPRAHPQQAAGGSGGMAPLAGRPPLYGSAGGVGGNNAVASLLGGGLRSGAPGQAPVQLGAASLSAFAAPWPASGGHSVGGSTGSSGAGGAAPNPLAQLFNSSTLFPAAGVGGGLGGVQPLVPGGLGVLPLVGGAGNTAVQAVPASVASLWGVPAAPTATAPAANTAFMSLLSQQGRVPPVGAVPVQAAVPVPRVSSAPAVAPPRQQQQQDDLHEETECVVCMEREREVLCLPCSHLCMCASCAGQVQARHGTCPMCHQQLEGVLEIA